MEYVIETKNLSKKFKTKLAANNVNMHIEKGSIYGFIGKNGAGKTTVMKLILGLLRPSGGEITINGSEDLNKQRARIGSLIEDPGIYKNCSAFENMKRYSILFNTSDAEIKAILKIVDLDKTGKKVAGQFSLGMKQRLGIAISLLGHPDILILDEPINGLDPAGIKQVRDTILRLNKEKGITFLISSHLLDELAKITTHYGIIRDGVLLEEISAKELMDRCVTNIKIVVDNPEEASKLLQTKKLINKYEIKDKAIYLYDSLDHPELIVEALVRDEFKVYEVSKNESAFENYFIERIGR
ncbi:MAG: ATP-binding cassette domain-containing protein [Bacilli bacterium]|nr:ATP-binding cassette domain-containing protein [Bacilli bacterium]